MLSRMALLLVACALMAAVAVQAQLSAPMAACAFDGMDFSSLTGSDIPGSDGTPQYEYYLNLCGTLTSPAAATCTQVQSTSSACQLQVQGGAQTFDIGNYSPSAPPVWSYIDDAKSGVMFQMNGAAQCWASGGSAAPYQANVILKCAPSKGDMVITSASQSCIKNFTIPTPLACKGSSGGGSGTKSGLSGGWVFIIILCVVIPLYVVGGCVYKSQKLGASGMDKCPNVEFWRDLPSLVKDGVAFTISKLRGLCGGGGGGASGASSYETM